MRSASSGRYTASLTGHPGLCYTWVMAHRPTQITAVTAVGWSEAVQYVTVDGDEVTHYGLDMNMTQYYRTAKHVYVKSATGWVRI